MPILVLQHSDSDHLGRLAPILRDHGHVLEVRRLDLAGQCVPADLSGYSAVISLGGPMNVTDNPPPSWLEAELTLIKAAHAKQLPVLGICLGAQIIAKALGGEVAPMTKPEFGFCPVNISVPGQTDTVMAGIAWSSRQWQCHAQEITKLPEGASLLASSPACKVQAFKVGLRTYGFQYHFESERSDIDAFLADGWAQGLMQQQGLSPTDICRQADDDYETFARLGDRLAATFAQVMFPPVRRLRTA